MNVRTFHVENRSGRLFARDGFATDEALRSSARNYWDDEDRARESLLQIALGQAVLRLSSHHGIDPAEARHLFIETVNGPVFTCVVVPQSVLERELSRTPFVQETFTFQVASEARTLTRASTIAAFESWRDRNFSGIPKVPVYMNEWSDDQPPSLAIALSAAESLGANVLPTNIYAGEQRAPTLPEWVTENRFFKEDVVFSKHRFESKKNGMNTNGITR
jgi:hypothetical protein